MFRYIKNFLALLGTLLVLVIFFGYFFSQKLVEKAVELPTSFVLSLELGRTPLVEDSTSHWGFGETGMSHHTLLSNIQRAGDDPRVHALFLKITGQKMSLAHIQEIRQSLMYFKSKGKKIYAYADTFGEMGSGMTSYYLASIAHHITLQPMGNVNITGLRMEVPFAKKALEDNHLAFSIEKREGYKSMPETMLNESFSPEARENAQTLLNDLFDQITSHIAHDRTMKKEELQTLIHKAPYIDKEALKHKLVDQLANEYQVIDIIEKEAQKTLPLLAYKVYASSSHTSHKNALPSIALIFAEGAIMRGHSPNPQEGQITNGHMKKAFEQAINTPSVQAIVLRVNSGGGSAIGSMSIWHEIMRAKEKGLKVIISMGGAAASGGYLISAPADYIMANDATLTGSIGVYGGKMITQALWKKYGVHWDHVEIGDHAGIWSTSRDYSDSERQRFKLGIDDIYEQFKDIVAKGRNLSKEAVQNLAQGKVYTGREAKKIGLVDEIGTLFDALKKAKELCGISQGDEAIVRIYPIPLSFKERLEELLSGSAVENTFTVWAQNTLRSMLDATYSPTKSPLQTPYEHKIQ